MIKENRLIGQTSNPESTSGADETEESSNKGFSERASMIIETMKKGKADHEELKEFMEYLENDLKKNKDSVQKIKNAIMSAYENLNIESGNPSEKISQAYAIEDEQERWAQDSKYLETLYQRANNPRISPRRRQMWKQKYRSYLSKRRRYAQKRFASLAKLQNPIDGQPRTVYNRTTHSMEKKVWNAQNQTWDTVESNSLEDIRTNMLKKGIALIDLPGNAHLRMARDKAQQRADIATLHEYQRTATASARGAGEQDTMRRAMEGIGDSSPYVPRTVREVRSMRGGRTRSVNGRLIDKTEDYNAIAKRLGLKKNIDRGSENVASHWSTDFEFSRHPSESPEEARALAERELLRDYNLMVERFNAFGETFRNDPQFGVSYRKWEKIINNWEKIINNNDGNRMYTYPYLVELRTQLEAYDKAAQVKKVIKNNLDKLPRKAASISLLHALKMKNLEGIADWRTAIITIVRTEGDSTKRIIYRPGTVEHIDDSESLENLREWGIVIKHEYPAMPGYRGEEEGKSKIKDAEIFFSKAGTYEVTYSSERSSHTVKITVDNHLNIKILNVKEENRNKRGRPENKKEKKRDEPNPPLAPLIIMT